MLSRTIGGAEPHDQVVLKASNTQTVVLDSAAAIGRLQALAAHGIAIAIDDFGTCYSSLTTLRSLPVNVIKLETSFTAGALTDRVDRSVITAIVQLGRELGIRTIAEGVERVDQLMPHRDTSTLTPFLRRNCSPGSWTTSAIPSRGQATSSPCGQAARHSCDPGAPQSSLPPNTLGCRYPLISLADGRPGGTGWRRIHPCPTSRPLAGRLGSMRLGSGRRLRRPGRPSMRL
ncbi:EAL domain-containing protein [Cryobacterium sp. Sr8]|uniref:EAL domain-containing protein n=1 Tax=Cryobacterium sp. Sr8 TaxID=1259203 RepID=UPI00141AEC11